MHETWRSSLRANGSRECAPDDRLREAIHSSIYGPWIASSLRSSRNDDCRLLRAHCRQPRHGREAGLAGIATHDGFALGIAQHVFDIVEAIGRQLLDRVDHAFGAAAAVRAHDLRRHRQSLLLTRYP